MRRNDLARLPIFLARQLNGLFPFLYESRACVKNGNIIRGPVFYLRDFLKYRSAPQDPRFRARLLDAFPFLYDRYQQSGELPKHYFLQDLWAARHVYKSGVEEHYDFGSRIDGFVAHCLVFCKVKVFDIRPLHASVENLEVVQADVSDLRDIPNSSVRSLSSLHAVEHVGLGRYGDRIDPHGYKKALSELERILAPGGMLYVSVPVGRERLEFNGHRIFAAATLPELLPRCELKEFSLIDDKERLRLNCDFTAANGQEYSCGLYRFEKRA
jgi:SAM-dependent methyltransferase